MKVIVTGGAGFIGCNLAIALAQRGDSVVLADNLSRPGSAANLESLRADPELSPRLTFVDMDVRDADACHALFANGAEFSVSVWAEFSQILEGLLGRPVPVKYDDWRRGDQRVYISDIRRVCDRLAWQPTKSPADGIAEVLTWVQAKV